MVKEKRIWDWNRAAALLLYMSVTLEIVIVIMDKSDYISCDFSAGSGQGAAYQIFPEGMDCHAAVRCFRADFLQGDGAQ